MTNQVDVDDGWLDRLMPEINDVIVKVSNAICADAKAVCPVDTGDLKRSLHVTNPSPGVGHVGSDLPYCTIVEMGFHGEEHVRAYLRQGHPVKAHTRRVKYPAQPYLRPSLYRTRDLSGLA